MLANGWKRQNLGAAIGVAGILVSIHGGVIPHLSRLFVRFFEALKLTNGTFLVNKLAFIIIPCTHVPFAQITLYFDICVIAYRHSAVYVQWRTLWRCVARTNNNAICETGIIEKQLPTTHGVVGNYTPLSERFTPCITGFSVNEP